MDKDDLLNGNFLKQFKTRITDRITTDIIAWQNRSNEISESGE
jgi:hypothetical protein